MGFESRPPDCECCEVNVATIFKQGVSLCESCDVMLAQRPRAVSWDDEPDWTAEGKPMVPDIEDDT